MLRFDSAGGARRGAGGGPGGGEVFVVHHYAGAVRYDSAGFLAKNRDALHADVAACARASSLAFVAALFPAAAAAAEAAGCGSGAGRGTARRRGKAATVGATFRRQLAALAARVRRTRVQYVRCVKPNGRASPEAWDAAGVAAQLKASGVLAAVRISRQCFPNTLAHAAFAARFGRPLLPGTPPPPAGERAGGDALRGWCERALVLLLGRDGGGGDGDGGQGGACWQVGRARAYFRAGALERLEARRRAVLRACAVALQRCARGRLGRRAAAQARARRAAVRPDSARSTVVPTCCTFVH